MTAVLDRDRMRIAAAAVLFGILAMAAPWASKAGEQFVSVIVRALPARYPPPSWHRRAGYGVCRIVTASRGRRTRRAGSRR